MAILTLPTRYQAKTILNLSLPILGGIISLNLLWLIDTAMIGRLGTVSLAAVGFGGFLIWLSFSPFFGLVSALQTITARYLGERRRHDLLKPFNSSLPLNVVLAFVLSIILTYISPTLFRLLSTDPLVVAKGTQYFQIRIAVLVFFVINITFRGFWSGLKKPKVYFNFLYVMHASNIFLNWVLIYGNLGAPALGVNGAAIASSFSIFLGTCYYCIHAWVYLRKRGMLKQLPSFQMIKNLIKIGAPLSLEETLFAGSFTMFLFTIDKLGTAEVAITNVIRHISLFLFLPGRAFGVAAASLVSASIGSKQLKQAALWPWLSCKVLIGLPLCLGLVYIIFARQILGVFIPDSAVIDQAIPLLRIDGIHLWTEALYLVFLGAYVGVGVV